MKKMNRKIFLDTSIIVCANDSRDTEKQIRAIDVVSTAMESGGGVISSQVLMEYASVALQKLGQSRDAVTRQLFILERLEVIMVTGEIIRDALELMGAFSLSFWDGVIIASATRSRADILLTEDLTHGARYGMVQVQNPFLN